MNTAKSASQPLTDQQHPDEIRSMFARIAQRYSMTNSALSLGVHWLWKRRLVTEALKHSPSPERIADCASGPGDIALYFSRLTTADVYPSDFCTEMMIPGKRAHSETDFHGADITKLPYRDGMFDILSISFGVRNVPDRETAYEEVHRVLRPGGIFAILEFGRPWNPVIRSSYDFFSSRMLPAVGGLLTGQPAAYSYLHNTSAEFPCGQSFQAEVESCGMFVAQKIIPLWMGVCWVYIFQRRD